MKENKKPLCHLVSQVTHGVNVKVPAMQERGAALTKPVKLLELYWKRCQYRKVVKFQWLPLDGAVYINYRQLLQPGQTVLCIW